MESDEDDFFAYQTAKSLNNKRSQLKQFFQAPATSRQSSSSSNTDSDSEHDLISTKKNKSTFVTIPIQSILIQTETIEKKDLIKNEIDAIVTSCFTSKKKEVKRKIKLGKRTLADDQEYEDEDEYLMDVAQQNKNGPISRAKMNSLNKSTLDDDDEKVTRETAAYTRLDAVLRVTKPLCEKQIQSVDDNVDYEDYEPTKTTTSSSADTIEPVNPVKSSLLKTITLIIDHSDGRQLNLSVPSSITLKSLSEDVAERLSLPSIYLVYNDQTLKLDDNNQSMTLQQLNFSSNDTQLESYPLVRKINIFIQTSATSARRSSFVSKREYTILDTDRFEIIFDAYKRDMKTNNIRFEFDGDTLHPHATPVDYDITGGEILDAFILPTSNNNNNKQKNELKAKKAKEIIFDNDSDD
ncbi:unnamed protein product [Rotaria magnacalcarata]|uniref:Rad60/SUMO-like domain-containing protein n=3 Tax=Rotaria magnacalcarata TaxID=392030 RepID=A0A819T703_9BILA|nr:unnamed protein product [Rotaria magnacalcarata]CAF1216549.1 unnamed protein product [Rotaria magnacalcarata]CAF1906026.1 unnamed protein product [Rotaria magnacalcarata]CAF1950093.1 unnamed protein product [Rotaria magnacalcarata]CAF3980181.1 unnamed protein product [Rotaria magnacalcarata]